MYSSQRGCKPIETLISLEYIPKYGGWHQKSCTRQACQDTQWRVQDFWCQPPYMYLTLGKVIDEA